jgi:hypothetical protein
MPNNGGYLILFDEAQRARFLTEVRDLRDGFSDAISAADWPVKGVEVCGLLFDNRSVSHFALATRGRKAATGKWRVHFSDVIDVAVDLAALESQLTASLRPHLVSARSGTGSRVPPATWEALKGAIRNSNAEAGAAIDRLEQLRDRSGQLLEAAGARIVAQQRDATGVALEVFDSTGRLRTLALKTYLPRPRQPLTSFLDGVEAVRALEGHLIARDAAQFPDAEQTELTVHGAVFSLGGRNLEVFNVDRTELEKSLGVDLIYWNERFDAWTLVQYKAIQTSETSRDGRTLKRDEQFEIGLSRMTSFRERVPDTDTLATDHLAYRLSADGFFFKLCSRLQVRLHTPELLPGMYLPRELIQSVCAGSAAKTLWLDRDAPGRHLDNTAFATLVRSGWVGTRGLASEEVAALLKGALAGGRGFVIARERKRGTSGNLKATRSELGLQ